MLRGIWAALLAVLVLGGCGRGSEDFTVRIARPAERVAQELGHVELNAQLASRFPGMKVERSAPAKDEVVYTIPGDSDFPATIQLTFEAVEGGKETVVHAAVDVPTVKIEFEGKAKQLSEFKVERALRKLIEEIGGKLEAGEDTAPARKSLSGLLTALAIVTDSKQLALAKDIERNPDWYMGGLDSLYGGEGDDESDRADAPAPAYGHPAAGEDPNAAARRQQSEERERAADAAAPMDEAKGEDPRGGGYDE